MIVFLATPSGIGSFTDFLPNYLRPLRRKIQALTYGQLANRTELPTATYIFSDFERMNAVQRGLAQQIYEQIKSRRPDILLLNEPARYKPRFQFMRELYERGINGFNVYRVHELDSHVRYPVIVRLENDHTGPRTDLLHNDADLHLALKQAFLGGIPLQDLMIVEFEDTRRPDGYYEVYGASKFGDRVVARHKNTHDHWIVKGPHRAEGDRWEPWQVEEDRAYQRSEAHEGVAEIFAIAGLDWGRADYAMRGERLVIYEVNSNPGLIPQQHRYLPERQDSQDHMVALTLEHLERLDCKEPPTPIPIRIRLEEPVPA